MPELVSASRVQSFILNFRSGLMCTALKIIKLALIPILLLSQVQKLLFLALNFLGEVLKLSVKPLIEGILFIVFGFYALIECLQVRCGWLLLFLFFVCPQSASIHSWSSHIVVDGGLLGRWIILLAGRWGSSVVLGRLVLGSNRSSLFSLDINIACRMFIFFGDGLPKLVLIAGLCSWLFQPKGDFQLFLLHGCFCCSGPVVSKPLEIGIFWELHGIYQKFIFDLQIIGVQISRLHCNIHGNVCPRLYYSCMRFYKIALGVICLHFICNILIGDVSEPWCGGQGLFGLVIKGDFLCGFDINKLVADHWGQK